MYEVSRFAIVDRSPLKYEAMLSCDAFEIRMIQLESQPCLITYGGFRKNEKCFCKITIGLTLPMNTLSVGLHSRMPVQKSSALRPRSNNKTFRRHEM